METESTLAAHDYWPAHNRVKDTILKILFGGQLKAKAFRHDHTGWFQNTRGHSCSYP
jgi:hypothetical protein